MRGTDTALSAERHLKDQLIVMWRRVADGTCSGVNGKRLHSILWFLGGNEQWKEMFIRVAKDDLCCA